MNRFLCNLTVENSLDMSMQCQKLKMIEKSIRKKCTNAKNAESSFSDLIKICQKIKSINMRKDQIFSIFLDRILVLQDRDVMIA